MILSSCDFWLILMLQDQFQLIQLSRLYFNLHCTKHIFSLVYRQKIYFEGSYIYLLLFNLLFHKCRLCKITKNLRLCSWTYKKHPIIYQISHFVNKNIFLLSDFASCRQFCWRQYQRHQNPLLQTLLYLDKNIPQKTWGQLHQNICFIRITCARNGITNTIGCRYCLKAYKKEC